MPAFPPNRWALYFLPIRFFLSQCPSDVVEDVALRDLSEIPDPCHCQIRLGIERAVTLCVTLTVGLWCSAVAGLLLYLEIWDDSDDSDSDHSITYHISRFSLADTIVLPRPIRCVTCVSIHKISLCLISLWRVPTNRFSESSDSSLVETIKKTIHPFDSSPGPLINSSEQKDRLISTWFEI